jgi:hypothetical protein
MPVQTGGDLVHPAKMASFAEIIASTLAIDGAAMRLAPHLALISDVGITRGGPRRWKTHVGSVMIMVLKSLLSFSYSASPSPIHCQSAGWWRNTTGSRLPRKLSARTSFPVLQPPAVTCDTRCQYEQAVFWNPSSKVCGLNDVYTYDEALTRTGCYF